MTARSRPTPFGWSRRKAANALNWPLAGPPLSAVGPGVKVNRPRGLNVAVCNRSRRSRRRSKPHLITCVPLVLVQLLTTSKLVTARRHGRQPLIPIIGVSYPLTKTSGMPLVFVNGYDTPMIGVNGCLPWRRAVTNFDFVNNWTKIKGTHLIKWGADIRRERQDLLQTATFSPRGRFTFTPGPTSLNGGPAGNYANAFAAFLLDQPNSVGRDLAVYFTTRRNTIYNLYFQDKWQFTQKLTLDLGLRWEYWPASTVHFPGDSANYIPADNQLEV